MSRIHGRHGLIYLQVGATGEAVPLPFTVSWDINYNTDRVEVSAQGDRNKVYVSGLPDASGSLRGFYDDASAQSYVAARDGLPRKLYLYPDRRAMTKYHAGLVLIDMQMSTAVSSAAEMGASWAAADDFEKYPAEA